MEGHHKRTRDALVAFRADDHSTLTYDDLLPLFLLTRELHEQVEALYKSKRPCPGRYWRSQEVRDAIDAWNKSDERKRKPVNAGVECANTTASRVPCLMGPEEADLICSGCAQCYRSDVAKGFVKKK